MRLVKKYLIKRLQRDGFSQYMASQFLTESFNDILKNRETDFKQKIWSYQRGFFSDKTRNYGLTEENYRNYLSDWDYYKLHPINGSYSHWIDDKLTTQKILHPFSEYLPMYYMHLYKGKLLQLDDCPDEIEGNLSGLLLLLRKQKYLALKQFSGTLAEGFYKLEFSGEEYRMNEQRISEAALIEFFNKLLLKYGDYLLTEYLHPHKDIMRIWSKSPNTLRIMVLNDDPIIGPQIVRAYWRFGTSQTGVVDNPRVGGVICSVDVNSGQFYRSSMYKGEFLVETKIHPDTGVLIEGEIPDWDFIKTKIIEISKYIPELPYLGYDAIITDAGFKIIEINSHQGIKYLQHFDSLLENGQTKVFFSRLIEEKQRTILRHKKRTLPYKLRNFLKSLRN